MGYVTCFWMYRKLCKTTCGRSIFIPLINLRDSNQIKKIANLIDLKFEENGSIGEWYTLITKGRKSRLYIPNQEWLEKIKCVTQHSYYVDAIKDIFKSQ